MDVLRSIIQRNIIPLKILFFIDRLDEFGGEHEQLCEVFGFFLSSQDLQLSRRFYPAEPWLCFSKSFGTVHL
jgi:hypothetical protein